jgi:hypothetical protein
METLINIQNELKVPKGNVNKFGNYKYRSAEDILEAVKPLLSKYKALLNLSDEIVAIGNKIFLKATATITDANKDVITSFGYAETSEHKGMSAEQTTGTASSYARKYALNGLFLIDETEQDADSRHPSQSPKGPTMTLEYAENNLKDALTIEELAMRFKALSPDLQAKTVKIKDDMKIKLTPKK